MVCIRQSTTASAVSVELLHSGCTMQNQNQITCLLKAAVPNLKGESRGGTVALAVKLPAAQSRPMSDRAPQSVLSFSVQGGLESNPR